MREDDRLTVAPELVRQGLNRLAQMRDAYLDLIRPNLRRDRVLKLASVDEDSRLVRSARADRLAALALRVWPWHAADADPGLKPAAYRSFKDRSGNEEKLMRVLAQVPHLIEDRNGFADPPDLNLDREAAGHGLSASAPRA